MTSDFIKSQLDYIFFLYGFAFILLAAICYNLHKQKNQSLPWLWLGLFGLTHGINEWLDLLTIDFGDGHAFSIVRFSFMTTSFLFLFEFGRTGLPKHAAYKTGRWIYLPLLTAVSLGSMSDMSGLNVCSRYGLGFVGGLCAALAMLHAWQKHRDTGASLLVGSAAMALYGLAAGVIVPASSFFPASVYNHDAFFATIGLPIQAVRGLLAVVITAAIWRHHRILCRNNNAGIINTGNRDELQLAAGLIAITLCGWIATSLVGNKVIREQHDSLLNKTRLAANAFDPDWVVTLQGTLKDLENPCYKRLINQVAKLEQADPAILCICLIGERDGEIYKLIDYDPEEDIEDLKRDTACVGPSRNQSLRAHATGQSFTIAPYKDRRGLLVSGFAPIRMDKGSPILGVLQIDLDGNALQQQVAESRLAPICVTLLLALLQIGYFTSRQKLREAAERIAISEQRYRVVADSSSDWIYWIGPNRNFVYISPACEQITGYPVDAFYKDAGLLDKIVYPDDQPLYRAHCAGEYLESEATHLEFRIIRKDGRLRWLSHVCKTILDDSGKAIGRRASNRDITEQKEAALSVRESEEIFRGISSSALDGIVMIDSDGRITFWNEAAEKMFGYSREEAIGQILHSLIAPLRHQTAYRAGFAMFRNSGNGPALNKTVEMSALRRNGTEFPVELSIAPLRLRDQWYAAGFIRDITNRKQVEEQLRKLSLAVQQSPVSIVIMNTRGQIEYVNPKFTEVTGYTPEEVFGVEISFMRSGKMDPEVYKHLWQMIADGRVWRGDLHSRKKNGEMFWESVSISPIWDAAGVISHYIAIKEDITEHKLAEETLRETNAMIAEALKREKQISMELEATMQQLAAATQEAQMATQAKSAFLANMSHEIRTPMTAILGFAELLEGAADPPQVPNAGENSLARAQNKEYLRTIRRNAEHLLEIINDILDISKIESDKMELEHIPCSPFQIIADVESLMRVRAEMKALTLNIEYTDAIPEMIETDSTRLRQILLNLIGNAIKFTETGGIRIVVRCVLDNDRGSHRDATNTPYGPCLQFDVIDTGVGLTPEQATRLFVPFNQADASTTRKFGGTGLGLTISKRLARLLGGDVEVVHSSPGKGTCFRVTIATGRLKGVKMIEHPLSATVIKTESKTKADPEMHLACRILLAEDGPDNQRLISFILKKAGAEVAVAENGKVAVEKAGIAIAQGQPYDIILMDMQMPIMDGYDATKTLRQSGYLGIIIALTANAMATDRDKCIEAGCNDFCTKPIDRRVLFSTIQKHLELCHTTGNA